MSEGSFLVCTDAAPYFQMCTVSSMQQTDEAKLHLVCDHSLAMPTLLPAALPCCGNLNIGPADMAGLIGMQGVAATMYDKLC